MYIVATKQEKYSGASLFVALKTLTYECYIFQQSTYILYIPNQFD